MLCACRGRSSSFQVVLRWVTTNQEITCVQIFPIGMENYLLRRAIQCSMYDITWVYNMVFNERMVYKVYIWGYDCGSPNFV